MVASVTEGLCQDLNYDRIDAMMAPPSDLDWLMLCASATLAFPAQMDTNICVPDFADFDFTKTMRFCTGGDAVTQDADQCNTMLTEDHCNMLDSIVWSNLPIDKFGNDNAAMRYNCEWKEGNTAATKCQSVADLDACGEVKDNPSPDNFPFDDARLMCTAQDLEGDEFDCVVVSRNNHNADLTILENTPLCNNIRKGLNICEADYLQYGSGDRCGANSTGENKPGYPRCTWESTLATGYPKPAVGRSFFELPRPCFSSPCDRVVPPGGGYKSFFEYATACIGKDATPNQQENFFPTTGGSVCLPRITDHNFGTAPAEDAYCSIQAAPACNLFQTEDSCHYASLSVFMDQLAPGANPYLSYPSCQWDGTGSVCTDLLLVAPTSVCASAKPAVGTPLSSDKEYAKFCGAQKDGCIPRGSVTNYLPTMIVASPYCTQLTDVDLRAMDEICKLPTFQEVDFCNEVGLSLVGNGTHCYWQPDNGCRARADDTLPGDNDTCTTATIDTSTRYATYADHVAHCDNVKNASGTGVCLPAEGVYDYDKVEWTHDGQVTGATQCRNYTEDTLVCSQFKTDVACEYVDENVFSINNIFFGRRCSWAPPATPTASGTCAVASDLCSSFDAANAQSTPMDYDALVTSCADFSDDLIVVDPDNPIPMTRRLCVPELRSFDHAEMTRNTCQFVDSLDCESYIAQTEDNCTKVDRLFPRKTCQWNEDETCSDYESTQCEMHKVENPSDYETYYSTCSEFSEQLSVCLPYVETVKNDVGDEELVYRCENYQPQNVNCQLFIADAMSQDSCQYAHGLVIPYQTHAGMDYMAFVCEWHAPVGPAGVGSCEDRSAENDCTAVNFDPNATLFAQAEACFDNSLTNQPEEADDVLCWPLIDDSVSTRNKCDLGRKDGAAVTCASGLFDENTSVCDGTANEWGPGLPDSEGNPPRPDSFFPHLTSCKYLKVTDGVEVEGCYRDLPSELTGCGMAAFQDVPVSFEEYFDMCLGVQMVEPYTADKECVPALLELSDTAAPETIKCAAMFGPMNCELFSNEGILDTAADRCLAADVHLFERDDGSGTGSTYPYGLSCYPEVRGTDTHCSPRGNKCSKTSYTPSATEESTTEPDTETPSEWKAYNDKCMEESDYTMGPADLEHGFQLANYCVAQIPELLEVAAYNTCTSVAPQNLDCTLPQFQSEAACDTMKVLEIRKMFSTEDDTFSLKCKWIPADDSNPGHCKSGMAKLLVPALMVLVSLLL